MTALYNDNEPFVCDWLEDLINHGLIAPGRVDRRSIADLTPADLAGPGQRHFFAGIGGWSYALRIAGVPDDATVWTGSCPCQPLSDAGQRRGFLDPRHLWPAWFALIRECRPPIVFGEQVASKLGLEWLDLVCADLEGHGYTVGAADLCAASVGAPHIRQRLFFVAYADGEPGRLLLQSWRSRRANAQAGGRGEDGSVADAARGGRRQGDHGTQTRQNGGPGSTDRRRPRRMANPGRAPSRDGRPASRDGQAERRQGAVDAPRRRGAGLLADSDSDSEGLEVVGQQPARAERTSAQRGSTADVVGDTGGARARRNRGGVPGPQAPDPRGRHAHRPVGDVTLPPGSTDRVADTAASGRPEPQGALPARADQPDPARLCAGIPDGATRGSWHPADWILCRDPSGGPPVARPVEPGTQPLASGVPQRVGLLSGYGNAIVPQVAAQFIIAALEAISESQGIG